MDESILWTMDKTKVSSANSFAVDERLWLRSFIYIRKKSDPKTDPWGTPASIGHLLNISKYWLNIGLTM